MIERIEIYDYPPIVQATLRLTRIHALVGPNDTGKSRVLEVIRGYAISRGFRVRDQWDFDGAPSADLITLSGIENGKHPCRMRNLVQRMRECTGTQFIFKTYSPLLINELEPEEVTIVTRPEGGPTKCTPIVEMPNFIDQSRIFALGDYWCAYSDGIHA